MCWGESGSKLFLAVQQAIGEQDTDRFLHRSWVCLHAVNVKLSKECRYIPERAALGKCWGHPSILIGFCGVVE